MNVINYMDQMINYLFDFIFLYRLLLIINLILIRHDELVNV